MRELGTDIEVIMAGSRTRGTGANGDSDLDLQVRRTGDRANESFTGEDKLKVMRNLEHLPILFQNVSAGNVSIKFVMQGRHGVPIRVDLVLFRQRAEEFPCLRGGKAFYNKSARINRIFKECPAVAAAVTLVKTLLRGGKRPKGLLLGRL